jgi:putative transposase
MIIKAYKTELKLNNKQKGFFNRCFGATRFVYNWGLAEWKRQYEAGEKPSRFKLEVQFNAKKDSFAPWIREIPYAVTGAAFESLGRAFDNFFRRVKNGEKEAGYPKFKKRGGKNSARFKSVRVEAERVRITGIGWVKLKQKEYIPVVDRERYLCYATVSEMAGKYFISVQVEQPDEILEVVNGVVGIDVGISSLAVCSDGSSYDNLRALNKYEARLKKLSRELSRRTRGGSNYKKTKAKLSKLHYKVACIRENHLHTVSSDIISKAPAVIVTENLNVSGMVRNHKLAKALSDASFGELTRQINYKAGWAGIKVIQADRFYPSSKTCSRCGAVKSHLSLSTRIFKCGQCGLIIDRDLNAAINLAALGNQKAETQPDCLGS